MVQNDDYDKRIRWERRIRVDDELYIYWPQHVAIACDSEEESARKEYTKLMPRTPGLYKVTEDQLQTVVIDEDGKLNKLEIDSVILVQEAIEDAKQGTNLDSGMG